MALQCMCGTTCWRWRDRDHVLCVNFDAWADTSVCGCWVWCVRARVSMLTDVKPICVCACMHECMHAMLINHAHGCIRQLCTTLRTSMSIALDATHCQQRVHFLLLLLRFCLRLLPQSRHALQVLVLLVAFPQCHSVHVYTRDGGESHRTQETTKAVKRGSATHLSANDTLPRAADTNDASAAAGT